MRRDENYWAAYKRWWDEDYSWDGLKKESSLRSGGSLRTYWESEQGRLIDFAGRQWTQYHLPMHDPKGENLPDDLRERKINAFDRGILEKLDANFVKETSALPALEKGERPYKAREDGEPRFDVDLSGVVFPVGWRVADRKLPATDWENVIFCSDAVFERVVFAGKTRFARAFFGEEAHFIAAKFRGTGFFKDACFSGNLSVGRLSKFSDDAYFRGALFCGKCDFVDVNFRKVGSFWRARFIDDAWFSQCTFGGEAVFRNAHFEEDARFDGRTWKDRFHPRSKRRLIATKFHGPLNISGDGGIAFGSNADFSEVEFLKDVDFHGRKFAGRGDFRNSIFHGTPIFHNCELPADLNFDGAQFRARGWRPAWGERIADEFAGAFARLRRWHRGHASFHPHNQTDARLEHAYRTLRQASRDQGHFDRELMFGAYEFDARRRRTDVSLFERMCICLFRCLSNYSRSFMRPLVWWVIGIFLWPAILWQVLQASGVSLGYFDVMRLVGPKFLPPPSGWSKTDLVHIAGEVDVGHGYILQIFAGFQIIWTVVLFTLLIIAVRRRFALHG